MGCLNHLFIPLSTTEKGVMHLYEEQTIGMFILFSVSEEMNFNYLFKIEYMHIP